MSEDDLLADLPPQQDDEPSSLRQDIVDELADHLACAFHRELVRSGDAETAQQRVLDRFGDPKGIALQLWLQAMWSRIMLKRIGLGMQIALLLAVVVASGLMMRTISQMPTAAQLAELRMQSESNRQMLATVLERLPAPSSLDSAGTETGGMPAGGNEMGMSGVPMLVGMAPSGMEGGMGMMGVPPSIPPEGSTASTKTTLTVKLVVGSEDGPPQQRGIVTVYDEAKTAMPIWQTDTVTKDDAAMKAALGTAPLSRLLTRYDSGIVTCPHVKPGRYLVELKLPEGLVGTMRVVVHADESKMVTFVSPPSPSERLVTISAPSVPEDLREFVTLRLMLDQQSDPGAIGTWRQDPPRSWTLSYTGSSRLPEWIYTVVHRNLDGRASSSAETNFRPDEPERDRFVTLFDGEFSLRWTVQLELPATTDSATLRLELTAREDPSLQKLLNMTRLVSTEVTHWDCAFSEEVWRRLRAEVAKSRPTFKGVEAMAPANDQQLPATATVPLNH